MTWSASVFTTRFALCVDDDDLPPFAGVAEMRHELLENGIWIEVLFGLVDNQGPLIVQVDREVQQQQNNAARSRRELLDRNAVIFDAVAKLMWSVLYSHAEIPCTRRVVGPRSPKAACSASPSGSGRGTCPSRLQRPRRSPGRHAGNEMFLGELPELPPRPRTRSPERRSN